MKLKLGLCVCGSFCTLKSVICVAKKLVDDGYEVIPVFSYSVAQTDTRFFMAEDFKTQITEITGNIPIVTIKEAEPIGPKKLFDAIAVVPTTGNTLAKIAHGITDTPVTMAVKAHLRNNRPVIISVSTNDGLSASGENIGKLLNRKNIYFVPFGQDDMKNKPCSLVANNDLVGETIEAALLGTQLQPLLYVAQK